MLASARERHPRHSVGHIGLLSPPDPPGGGGVGGEGGMNKALKFLQPVSARPLNDFYNAIPCRTCVSSYQKWSNSCTATPFPSRRAGEGGGVSGGKLPGSATPQTQQTQQTQKPQRPSLAPTTSSQAKPSQAKPSHRTSLQVALKAHQPFRKIPEAASH